MKLTIVKKILFLLPFSFLLIIGCKKDEQEMSSPDFILPEVKTVSVIKLGRNFEVRCSITMPGSLPILEKGICYDTFPRPILNDSKVINSHDTNFYTCHLVNLKAGTKYYVRSFALSKDGISYGNELSLITESSSALVVGDFYQGGIIGYIVEPGNSRYVAGEVHGITVAPSDQSDSAIWGGGELWGSEIGDGILNTESSVRSFGLKVTAARICYDLELNGYKDWYLPCAHEFYLISPNWELFGLNPERIYWTSTLINNPFSDPNGPYFFWYKNEKFLGDVIHMFSFQYDRVKTNVRAIRIF